MNIINATRKIRHIIKKSPKSRKILLNNSLYTKLSKSNIKYIKIHQTRINNIDSISTFPSLNYNCLFTKSIQPSFTKDINKKKGVKPSNLSFTESDKNRLIEMAWQDRVSFDTIKELYGFTENEVKNMMRELLKRSSFKMWRKRVQGRATKHKLKVSYKTTRFQ
jgi:uncharacterized protein (TIGR03643 family)